jgi:hypothetical protein
MTLFALAYIVVPVLIVVAIITAVRVARAGRVHLTLQVTRVIAVIYATTSVVASAVVTVSIFVGDSVHVALPVREFWPSLPPGAKLDAPQATVVGGGFDVASVTVSGLDLPTRIWLAADQLLQGATAVIIAIVLISLCTSVLRLNPFRAALIRGITVAAATVIAGGILWQLCGAIGGLLASYRVLNIGGAEFTDVIRITDLTTVYGMPRPGGGSFMIDLWPFGIGIALLAIAAAFRYGERLQKDTEGLV